MGKIVSFTCTALILTMLTALTEFLLPAGRIRSTAQLGARLVFLSALCGEILRIFMGMGV